jgi:1-deoxy-D-xylulose-5-phosphate reductoisomerase
MLEESAADIVINGISGARGLLPSVKALQLGRDLALANKETIVMAGPLITELVKEHGSRLLPVDSEHHGLFCLLQERNADEIDKIILTASGGAFRELSYEQLYHVRREDAITHPNWKMGAKITVDSATMANKGLEVIEAHHLFGVPVSAIEVLIHPQSYVHSLVRTIDGFLYAQISQPDMRLPIQDALTYPELRSSGLEAFDLTGKALSFEPVDSRKYGMLDLAYQAAEGAQGYAIAYNAANEVAVQRFLGGEIPFLKIPQLVEEILQADWNAEVRTVEQILQIDERARIKVEEILERQKVQQTW